MVSAVSDRFFYGWVIVGVCALGLFTSGPGQSHTFSVFIEPISNELGIKKASIASAYGVATLFAAFLLPYIGRLVDRKGPRWMLFVLVVLLGLACMFFGAASGVLWLAVGFAMLRLFGQGSLMLGCANMVSQWFSAKRGFAAGLMALGFGASMAIHPPLSNFLIDAVGWRMAWVCLGLLTWLLMLPCLYFLAVNTPEEVGLRPDGEAPVAAGESPQAIVGLTREEALRERAFYILAAVWFVVGGLVTVLHFFQVTILSGQGLSAELAASLFPVSALTLVIFMPLVGRLFDWLKTRYVIALALLVNAMALVAITFATSYPTALLYAFVFGITNAFMLTMFGYLWPRYFGRPHLGSIQGIGQMIGVVGASLGPIPVGWAIDRLGSGSSVLQMLAVLPVVMAAVCIFFLRTPSGIEAPKGLE
jgi:MFS family permease